MRFRRRADEATADGTPVPVAYAGVLDGRHLWLAVDAVPGRLALRSSSGDVLDLPDTGGEQQPGYLSARLDLAPLPAEAASYDVVLVAPDGVQPLTTDPLPPRQVPVLGSVRHALVRADEGALGLASELLAPSVLLDTVLLDADDVLVTAGGEQVRLTASGPVAPWSRVTAGDLPVRRRDNDLLEPGRAVPLPTSGRLRLRWSGDGLLQSRVVDQP